MSVKGCGKELGLGLRLELGLGLGLALHCCISGVGSEEPYMHVLPAWHSTSEIPGVMLILPHWCHCRENGRRWRGRVRVSRPHLSPKREIIF